MIRISVSFVLRLLDDFTGRAAEGGGHRFFVDGRPFRPLQKEEGCYVFLGCSTPCAVTVESGWYSPAKIEAAPGADDPVIPVRLLRRGEIRFPGCDRVEGKAPPGVTVSAFYPAAPPLSLKSGQGDTLTLAGYAPISLAGQRLSVGEGGKRELFTVVEALPDGSLRIAPPLRRRHKSGEPVERAGCCRSGADGRFAVCVERGAAERVAAIGYGSEGVKQWQFL